MFSYDFYKVMHFMGLFMTFSALGGQCVMALNGHDAKIKPARLWLAIQHGLGLFLVLVGGFGLLARIGGFQEGFPNWAAFKLVVWVLLGGIGALIARRKEQAGILWIVIIVLGSLAAYAARTKPF